MKIKREKNTTVTMKTTVKTKKVENDTKEEQRVRRVL